MTTDESKALEAVRAMQWEKFDYDFHAFIPSSNWLCDVVNVVAMAGAEDPVDTVLCLLAKGKIAASGHWEWKEYKNWECFELAGHGVIPTEKWHSLLSGLRHEDKIGFDPVYEYTVKLTHVEDFEARKFDLDWRGGTMSLADIVKSKHGSDAEFSYRASNIEIMPPEVIINDEIEPLAITDTVTPKGRGGAPQRYDWEKAVAALVFRWADGPEWQPSLQADVARALADWFDGKGATPSDSLLKERARWLFPLFDERKPDGQ